MIRIANAQLWVHDQDEALDFYTEKLGMEVRADVTLPEMGDFRWLTVGPAGQPDVAIVLMAIPGPPVMDAETAEQVRDLMAKGFAGTVFLTTDDCQASYEELKARGVEFTEQPEERPYGIDSAFRDPSGNSPPAHAGRRSSSPPDGPVASAAEAPGQELAHRVVRRARALELRDVPAVELEVLGGGSAFATWRGEADRDEPVSRPQTNSAGGCERGKARPEALRSVRLLEVDVPRRGVECGAAPGVR